MERIQRAGDKLESVWKMAGLVHPERPLSRGFVRVTDRSGTTITRAADALAARTLTLRFGDGAVAAIAGEAAGISPKAQLERGRKRSYPAPQRGLFDEPQE